MDRKPATKAIASYTPDGILVSLTIPDFEDQEADPAFNPGGMRVELPISEVKGAPNGTREARVHAAALKAGIKKPRMANT